MANVNKIIKDIKEQKIGASDKRVFVVEGVDDVRSFEHFMSNANSDWSLKWIVAQAGSKRNVIEIIEKEAGWVGLVDRDDWREDRITELSHQHDNLLFLPRYCIENYLVHPEELWQALPEKQKVKIDNGLEGLREILLAELDKWVRHGTLWSVINPLWEGLRSLGFKNRLLDPEHANDEHFIKKTLGHWHEYLEPERILQEFNEKLGSANSKELSEKLSLHIHGKYFYEHVVNPALDRLLGQKAKDNRQFSIIKNLPLPEDLNFVWQRLELM